MALRIFTRRGEVQETVRRAPSLVGVTGLHYAATPPSGWLVCDGSSFSGVTYPELAAFLGGTTLPDYNGRLLAGVGPHADVAAVGDDDGLVDSAREPNHGHAAGAGGHTHSANHSHTAAAHSHTTPSNHNHGSVGHSHTSGGHPHGAAGTTNAPNQTVSADGVVSGTQSRGVAHQHSIGSITGDSAGAGTLVGYAGVNGGFTSTDAAGSTGSGAPVDHASTGEATDNTVEPDADDVEFPYLAGYWIIKAEA